MKQLFEVEGTYSESFIREAIHSVTEGIPDARVEEIKDGEACLSVPTFSRFHRGDAVINLTWTLGLDKIEFTTNLIPERITLTGGGKILLLTGALGSLPWLLWPFFPVLLGWLPLGVLFLFLAWMTVGRRPHSLTTQMIRHQLTRELTIPDQ